MEHRSFASALSWPKTLASAAFGCASAGIFVAAVMLTALKASSGGVGLGTVSPVLIAWTVVSPLFAILFVKLLAGTWKTERTIAAALIALLVPPLIFMVALVFIRSSART